MSNPKFEIKNAAGGQFRFNLKAGNGEKILTGETYVSKQGCREGIASVKTNAPFDSRYVKKDSPGNYRFNLTAGNGQVIGTSEGYTSEGARDRGIESVKRNALVAGIEDLT